jgi:hypothetical protein
MLLPTSRKKNAGWPGEEEAALPSAEENMASARRFLEARIKEDLDTVDEMMPPDFVSHTKLLPDQDPTREGQKWAYAHFSAAVSNPSIHFEDHRSSKATRWLPASSCMPPTIEGSSWALLLAAGS